MKKEKKLFLIISALVMTLLIAGSLLISFLKLNSTNESSGIGDFTSDVIEFIDKQKDKIIEKDLEERRSEINEVLAGFYKNYERKKFVELEQYLAPEIKQYISLKNTSPEAIIKNAQRFFANKEQIEYKAFLDNMIVSKNDDFVNAKLGLNMKWAWNMNLNDTQGEYVDFLRDVYVVVSVDFNNENQIVNYIEEYIIRPKYEIDNEPQNHVVSADENKDDFRGEPYSKFDLGTVVIDDFVQRRFDTPFSSWSTYEKRVISNGKKYWVSSMNFHEGDQANTIDQHLAKLSVNLPDEYEDLFENYYYIHDYSNSEGALMIWDKRNFNSRVLTNLKGDGFELGKIIDNKVIEIITYWHPVPFKHLSYYNLVKNEMIRFPTDELVKGIGTYKNNFYYMETHSVPFSIRYYYCQDEMGCEPLYTQVKLLNLDSPYSFYVSQEYYNSINGVIDFKSKNGNTFILDETIFDPLVELNWQSDEKARGKALKEKKKVIIYPYKPDKAEIGNKLFLFEAGRADPDINSLKSHSFKIPMYVTYESFGEDASGSSIRFFINNKEAFLLLSVDYTQDEEWILESYKNLTEYSFVQDYTSVLRLIDSEYKREMEVFKSSYKINNENVF